jgi:hypothetical protein
MEIMGFARDARTGTRVIYAKVGIPAYLEIVGDEFDEFDIQRKRVQHKAYARMKEDIKSGTLLPAVTLAVKTSHLNQVIEAGEDKDALAGTLSQRGSLNILDGLQRTHTLKDIAESGHAFNPDQTLLLEIWVEPHIKNLIYRIIVLNAGQKPMSMRHQMELLFYSTKETLENRIPGLEIFTERDESRRTRAKKYPLDRVSLAYYSFITKSPEVNKDNIVAQQLQEEDVLAQGVESFGEKFERFSSVFTQLATIDQLAEDRYGRQAVTWIGSENFMLGFFAAAANADSRHNGAELVAESLDGLIRSLRDTDFSDPLGHASYQAVAQGIDSRKSNVGYATRRLIFNGFREFFRSHGEDPLLDIWPREAD